MHASPDLIQPVNKTLCLYLIVYSLHDDKLCKKAVSPEVKVSVLITRRTTITEADVHCQHSFIHKCLYF